MKNTMHIAPCGMNCSLCRAFQRDKNTCMGCNGPEDSKPHYCVVCQIKTCELRKKTPDGFCYSCEDYPCKRLKNLDKRYRTKYGMSMIENQKSINNNGVDAFIESEVKLWTCKCGSFFCVHDDKCMKCGAKNKRYGEFKESK